MKPHYDYKASNILPNHHNDLRKKYNIRTRYRVYLAEMKAYGWYPLDFRTWWSWEQNALKKNGQEKTHV